MAVYERISLGLWGGGGDASVRATADERYSKATPPSVHGALLWPVRLDVRIKEGTEASESVWGSV